MAARRRLTPWMIGVGGVTFLAGLLEEILERWVVEGDLMLGEEPA